MSAQYHRISRPKLRNAQPKDLSGSEKAISASLSPNVLINAFPELSRFEVDSIVIQ
jgi:hypothetical protein